MPSHPSCLLRDAPGLWQLTFPPHARGGERDHEVRDRPTMLHDHDHDHGRALVKHCGLHPLINLGAESTAAPHAESGRANEFRIGPGR